MMQHFLWLFVTSVCFVSATTVMPSGVSNGTLLWSTKVGCANWGPGCWIPGFQGTDSSPALSSEDAVVVIGSYDGYLYGVDSETGKIIYQIDKAGGEASPSIDLKSDRIVVWGGLTAKHLQSLNATDGSSLWEWSPDGKGEIAASGGIDSDRSLVFAGTNPNPNPNPNWIGLLS